MKASRGVQGILREYTPPLVVIVLTVFLFILAYIKQHEFMHLFDSATYLTWHNIFELTGALVCFAVFMSAFYTYNQNRNLRMIFIGSIFLCTGLIDLFHTFSYKGMPDFFIPNLGANRATTFWIASSIVNAAGFFAASFIPYKIEKARGRYYFLLVPLAVAFALFFAITYRPALFPLMYVEGRGLTQLKIVLEYVTMVFFALTSVRFIYEYETSRRSYHLLVLTAALILKISARVAFTYYSNVYDIYNYIGHIFGFIASFMIFRALFVIGVQRPYLELDDTRRELASYAENLDRLVGERTRELNEINQKLLDDLDYARDIQKALLPSVLPDNNHIGVAAGYYPAERVSGDFYNVFKLDDENMVLYIGDVSGHGVPAAMLTIFVNQTIKPILESEERKELLSRPELVLKNLLEAFNRTNFKEEVYLVLLYCVYNIPTKTLLFSSAGMNTEPIRIKESELSKIEIRGFPICKLLDCFPIGYQSEKLTLDRGEKILFTTDGLLEFDMGPDEDGISLESLLKGTSGLDACQLVDRVTTRLLASRNFNKRKDDITFFVLEVK